LAQLKFAEKEIIFNPGFYVELFGDVLSDSDAEDEEMGMGGGELDDESRISMDMEMEGDESSRMSDSAASFSQSHVSVIICL